MEISQDECRRWVERATTQAANAVALFDEAKRLQKENAALRAEVERLREALRRICVRYVTAYDSLPATQMADEFYAASCIATNALQPCPDVSGSCPEQPLSAPPAKEE